MIIYLFDKKTLSNYTYIWPYVIWIFFIDLNSLYANGNFCCLLIT